HAAAGPCGRVWRGQRAIVHRQDPTVAAANANSIRGGVSEGRQERVRGPVVAAEIAPTRLVVQVPVENGQRHRGRRRRRRAGILQNLELDVVHVDGVFGVGPELGGVGLVLVERYPRNPSSYAIGEGRVSGLG